MTDDMHAVVFVDNHVNQRRPHAVVLTATNEWEEWQYKVCYTTRILTSLREAAPQEKAQK